MLGASGAGAVWPRKSRNFVPPAWPAGPPHRIQDQAIFNHEMRARCFLGAGPRAPPRPSPAPPLPVRLGTPPGRAPPRRAPPAPPPAGLGSPEQALPEIECALSLSTDHAGPWLVCARALQRLGHLPQARDALRRCLSVRPGLSPGPSPGPRGPGAGSPAPSPGAPCGAPDPGPPPLTQAKYGGDSVRRRAALELSEIDTCPAESPPASAPLPPGNPGPASTADPWPDAAPASSADAGGGEGCPGLGSLGASPGPGGPRAPADRPSRRCGRHVVAASASELGHPRATLAGPGGRSASGGRTPDSPAGIRPVGFRTGNGTSLVPPRVVSLVPPPRGPGPPPAPPRAGGRDSRKSPSLDTVPRPSDPGSDPWAPAPPGGGPAGPARVLQGLATMQVDITRSTLFDGWGSASPSLAHSQPQLAAPLHLSLSALVSPRSASNYSSPTGEAHAPVASEARFAPRAPAGGPVGGAPSRRALHGKSLDAPRRGAPGARGGSPGVGRGAGGSRARAERSTIELARPTPREAEPAPRDPPFRPAAREEPNENERGATIELDRPSAGPPNTNIVWVCSPGPASAPAPTPRPAAHRDSGALSQ